MINLTREKVLLLSVLAMLLLVWLTIGAMRRANRATGADGGVAAATVEIPDDAPGYVADGAVRPSFAGTPTPDPTPAGLAATSDSGGGPSTYIIQAGDTLRAIADRYNLSVDQLALENAIDNPDRIAVGQILTIPDGAQGESQFSPAVKLIPDSELVYGPSLRGFSIDRFVPADSYLRSYSEQVEGTPLDGIQVVQLVAERTRVNPRLLLAALEHRAGWVMRSDPAPSDAPMQIYNGLNGLYRQLEWAANQLNLGYYGLSEGGRSRTQLADGRVLTFAPEINPGTAGVQTWLGAHSGATYDVWLQETSRDGFFATYSRMFGDPFAYTDEAFWPPTDDQPPMALPWVAGETWYFTGGPHGGWIGGSGWAALDFVPPGASVGCYESEAWLTAVADGVITRSDFGAVVLDLDGDGYTGTGWAVLYQHVATHERVAVGSVLKRGERIGHPSCEGGFSTGTHLHLARTYNGRWVAADGERPFDLAGWISNGDGYEYNGRLIRDGVVKVAVIARSTENGLTGE